MNPNFINLLQTMQGFGVVPLLYPTIKFLITKSLKSFLKSKKVKGICNFLHTFLASEAFFVSSPQSNIFTPITSYPCSLSRIAETELSTPPLIPNKTLLFIFNNLFYNYKFYIIIS